MSTQNPDESFDNQIKVWEEKIKTIQADITKKTNISIFVGIPSAIALFILLTLGSEKLLSLLDPDLSDAAICVGLCIYPAIFILPLLLYNFWARRAKIQAVQQLADEILHASEAQAISKSKVSETLNAKLPYFSVCKDVIVKVDPESAARFRQAKEQSASSRKSVKQPQVASKPAVQPLTLPAEQKQPLVVKDAEKEGVSFPLGLVLTFFGRDLAHIITHDGSKYVPPMGDPDVPMSSGETEFTLLRVTVWNSIGVEHVRNMLSKADANTELAVRQSKYLLQVVTRHYATSTRNEKSLLFSHSYEVTRYLHQKLDSERFLVFIADANKEDPSFAEDLRAYCKHNWDGCVCRVCGEKRNEEHSWVGCVCRACGEKRNEGHIWNGCKCKKCERTRDQEHDYRHIPDSSSGTQEWMDHGEYIDIGKSDFEYECEICGKQLSEEQYRKYLRTNRTEGN